VLAILAVLAGLAILCARAGGFDIMGKAVYGQREKEGGDGQEEESFHIFRFNTLKVINMSDSVNYLLDPIGFIRSSLRTREDAPRQGYEGAPDAWLEVKEAFAAALRGVGIGDEVIVITWFHLSKRDVLEVHPRGDRRNPLAGVFTTRSPDRPNPLGLHRVKVLEIAGARLKIGPIEALDGTPVVDIKPVLGESADA
jgi:tRNA-Thr(GGU) m(6)t(6)A37 methyltransferase TsaA